MKKSFMFAALVALTSSAAADVTITDNHQSVTVDCAKDPAVSVLGNHATVTLTGTCSRVTLAGNHNTVTGSATSVSVPGNHNTATLGVVDMLSVPGNHNTVAYKNSSSAKKKTKIGVTGNQNKITRAR
jgi:hypothetical protein